MRRVYTMYPMQLKPWCSCLRMQCVLEASIRLCSLAILRRNVLLSCEPCVGAVIQHTLPSVSRTFACTWWRRCYVLTQWIDVPRPGSRRQCLSWNLAPTRYVLSLINLMSILTRTQPQLCQLPHLHYTTSLVNTPARPWRYGSSSRDRGLLVAT